MTFHESEKNLLAFSAGIDSSALFFLLIENSIPFDMALVNYGTRTNSDKEEAHALALAQQYGLTCHTIKAPKFTTQFEKNARVFRYDFFERLIKQYGYDTLLTAHQLNDQLEWLLMRLSRGAGLSELVGLETVSQRKGYRLVRPLLGYSKEELLSYLDAHHHPYFIDESNNDEQYERNSFRKHFSDPLIKAYEDGIRRSFGYLKRDKRYLESHFEVIESRGSLRLIRLKEEAFRSKAADLALKELGYLLSAAQRREIEQQETLVIGGVWAVCTVENLLYIAPYLSTTMPKRFKEQCRALKIPSKIRPYLHQAQIDPASLPL